MKESCLEQITAAKQVHLLSFTRSGNFRLRAVSYFFFAKLLHEKTQACERRSHEPR